MTTPAFSLLSLQTIESIFNQISEQATLDDFDVDMVGDVLTMDFNNGKKMILNSQAAANQLWLASPEGPAYFNYDETTHQWRESKSQETLVAVISRVLSTQADEDIVIVSSDE